MKKLITFLAAIIIAVAPAALYSQNDTESILPEIIGSNNTGVEFWFTVPPCLKDDDAGRENRINIYVTSYTSTDVTVRVPAKGVIETKQTTPWGVTVFSLKPSEAQPYEKSGHDMEVAEDVYTSAGVQVLADEPVAVFVAVRYRNSSDGFTVMPVSSLGSEYIISSYPDMSAQYPFYHSLPSISGIVAAYDNTEVTFEMGGAEDKQSAGGLYPGQTKSLYLNRGDVWMFSSKGGEGDLSGSKVTATKPVAVVSGNQCANVPVLNKYCDYIAEMEIPTFAWGNYYHAPVFPERLYSPVFRIYAKYPDTKVYQDGNQIAYIPESGGVLDKAYIETRISNDPAPDPAVFHSDKPIFTALYNAGTEEDGDPQPNGDPFQMALLADHQFQNEILFVTPGMMNGISYPDNFLIIIYEKTPGGVPEALELGRYNGSEFDWEKVRDLPTLTSLNFAHDVNGISYAMAKIDLAKEGTYRLRGETPFGAYSYGYSEADSYGFPAAIGLSEREMQDTLSPIIKWTMDCNGDVFGTVTDMPDEETYRSNLAYGFLYGDKSDNYEFEKDKIEGSKTRTISWKLSVDNPDEDAKAIISFLDRNNNLSVEEIEYAARKISIEPAKIIFEDAEVGVRSEKKFKIFNNSEKSPVTITRAHLKYDEGVFDINWPDSDIIIGPEDFREFAIGFRTDRAGDFRDSIGIGDTCMFNYKAYVFARTAAPEIIVSDINFPPITVSQKSTREVTISNVGQLDLEITDFEQSGDDVFEIVDENGFRNDLPITLESGNEYKFEVSAKPSGPRHYSGSIIIGSNTSKSDSVCELSVRGVLPGLAADADRFDRKRVIDPDYFPGPYSGELRVYNTSQLDFTIEKVEIIEKQNGDYFDVDLQSLVGKNITPEDTTKVAINYSPHLPGQHYIHFEIISDNNDTLDTYISGSAYSPEPEAVAPDFHPTIVGNDNSVSTGDIIIKNSDTEWVAPLKIYNIISEPAGAVSFANGEYGSEGFGIDKSAIDFPVEINPKSNFKIPVSFHAKKAGDNEAWLVLDCDAPEEVRIHLTGRGLESSWTIKGGTVNACPDQTDILYAEVSNFGETILEFESLYFDPPRSELSFVDPAQAQGFTLPPDSTLTVPIAFRPVSKVNYSVDLTAETSMGEKSAEIQAGTILYKPKVSVDPAQQKVYVGETKEISVVLAEPIGLENAGINEFTVALEYEPTILKPYEYGNEEYIIPGEAIDGKFALENTNRNPAEGRIEFSFSSINGDALRGSGKLFTMRFNSFLPQSNKQESLIRLSANNTSNTCAEFTAQNGLIQLREVCADSLRNIITSGYEFSLVDPAPNPIGESGGEIGYSIGYETHTEIAIYDTEGKLVVKLVDGVIAPGNHTANIRPADIPSGTYMIEMTAGPFRDGRTVIIQK